MTDQVDAIVRVYDLAELPCVRSCVFALLGQARAAESAPPRIHLLTQRFGFGETKELRAALAGLLRLDDRVGLVLHNWDYRDPFDLRVPLLNLALEVTAGRYLTVLDNTDLLAPGALATLRHRLETTGAAAALGGTAEQRVRWWGDVFVPLAPPTPASAPLLLFDRARVAKTLRFQVSPPGTEISTFIDRLRAHHPVDDEHLPTPLRIRQLLET